jgi:hypothetical protein
MGGKPKALQRKAEHSNEKQSTAMQGKVSISLLEQSSL